MADDQSLDLVGAGKLAKAIPQKAWLELVHTACETFNKCLAPLTETTSGIGRLIQAKFDRLIDEEKVLAADVLAKATQKVTDAQAKTRRSEITGSSAKVSEKPRMNVIHAPVVLAAVEHAATQSDDTLRELWSNLLAQEILGSTVHPEFPQILSRLSADEARVLAQVAENSHDVSKRRKAYIQSVRISFAGISASLGDFVEGEPHLFAHEHLRLLNLIERSGKTWLLTIVGEEFIAAVSDPTI